MALARSRGIEVVLATFPYHASWAGRSPIAYPEFREALAESNRVTLAVAASTEAHGFDLAGRVPADDSLYVDGYHFTRKGNEVRSRLLAEWIVGKGILERVESPS